MMAMGDIVLVVALLLAVRAGVRSGLLAALRTLLGLVAGAVAMPWVLRAGAGATRGGTWRGVAVIGAAALLLLVGASIGSGIGRWLRRGADRLHLRIVER